MELICYVRPDWEPLIRPASLKRDWMDATVDSYAYRCLPLNIANSHGWEILSPCGFAARWDGGPAASCLEIRLDPGTTDVFIPVSLFGSGVLTFHVEGLFRTEPGWNLWVGGPPNLPKDGIAPLNGVIETDWSPYTFTMNWKVTRLGEWVRFDKGEPFCFIMPIQRGVLDTVRPTIKPMSDDPDLEARFEQWMASRLAFHQQMDRARPVAEADTWQKAYYRGDNPDGSAGAEDHQTKLRLCPFTG